MGTKKLYREVDKYLLKGCCFNLRKVRNLDAWTIKLWNSKELDKKGTLAPWVQAELYPEHWDDKTMKSKIMVLCKMIKV